LVQPIIDTDLLSQKLAEITGSLPWLLPEGVLTGLLLLLLLTDLIAGKKGAYWLVSFAILGFLGHLFTLFLQWQQLALLQQSPVLMDMLSVDGTSVFFRALFSLGGLLAVLLSIPYRSSYAHNSVALRSVGEFYVILSGLLLGASLMAMSVNLLMLFLAIEVVSISSYILTNFNFDKKSAEAGVKYLLFGGVASGLMLYGMSLLYGFGGTLQLDSTMAEGLGQLPFVPLTLSLLLVGAGLLFKISAVPFHIWAPDVYEGAPTPVVAVFSVVPKVAALAIIFRYTAFMQVLSEQLPLLNWQWLLSVIAIITIVVGNFAALSQRNAKRMLAYSSIAHSGFLLVGVIAHSEYGLSGTMYYAGIYLLMNFAAFLMVRMISRETGKEYMHEYKGLGKQFPLLGVLMLLVMISLTGLPPTAGFTAKFLIFSALWQTYQVSGSTIMALLLLIGLLNTVVSLFYYLKIPYLMFFKEKQADDADENSLTWVNIRLRVGDQVLAVLLVIPLLLLFFKADWLLDLINLIHF
jgi:NADH-quinone oxidoreductase subunit N